jgi:hypothetical protein
MTFGVLRANLVWSYSLEKGLVSEKVKYLETNHL